MDDVAGGDAPITCPQCGTENSRRVEACVHCGHRFGTPTPKSAMLPKLLSPNNDTAIGSDVEHPLPPGILVHNRYRIEESKGEGGMGHVYQVTDQLLEATRAVKFINAAYGQQIEFRRRFLNEAKMGIEMAHPNIVRIHHLDEWRGHLYIVMDYLDGETLAVSLANNIKQGITFDWPTVFEWMKELLEATDHAHSMGVVHRDLKPANIMLVPQNDDPPKRKVVVMDFGLAKWTEGLVHTTTGRPVGGTPPYWAPEQYKRGYPPVDGRADIHALGFIAYELLTNAELGVSSPAASSLRGDLPKGIDEWLLKACKMRPEERYQTAKEMLDALPGIAASRKQQSARERTSDGASSAVRQRKRDNRSPEGHPKDYVETHAGLNLTMLWIPRGKFEMGSRLSPEETAKRFGGDAHWYRREHPPHEVKLDGFWLAQYEVTQRQYEALMGKNPSHFKGPDRPVESVSWNDAMEFCRKLSEATGMPYTLPSEAQWEFACRAGSGGEWCCGDDAKDLEDYAWFGANSGNETHVVGEKQPNALGLYDMHGNVWEWCLDWYDEEYYKSSPVRNPAGPEKGEFRVLRGGAWLYDAWLARSAIRLGYLPSSSLQFIGFRVCRVVRP